MYRHNKHLKSCSIITLSTALHTNGKRSRSSPWWAQLAFDVYYRGSFSVFIEGEEMNWLLK